MVKSLELTLQTAGSQCGFLVEKCNQDYKGEQPECLPHSRDPDGQHGMLKIRSHGVRAFANIVSFDNLMEFIFL